MKVPAFTLVPMPESLSFEEGAAVSCGTGTAYGALKRLDVSGRDTLAVFGQGPVGLSATMLGRAMGARVIAVDISPSGWRWPASSAPSTRSIRARPTPFAPSTTSRTARAPRRRWTARATPSARAGGAERRHLGPRGVRGRGQQRHPRREPRPAPAPDHATRLVDVLEHRSGGVRPLRGRPQGAAGRLLTHRWRLDQADEAYRLFDTQTTGKGVFV